MKKQNELIKCACGCGLTRWKYDKRGRECKYIYSHQNKNRKFSNDFCEKISKTRKILFKEGKLKHWANGLNKNNNIILMKNSIKMKINNPMFNKEVVEKSRLSKIGKPNPKCSETKKRLYKEGKISPYWKNKNRLIDTKLKLSIANKGKHYSKETEFKKGDTRISGENNPNFNNWSSFEPYGPEFNEDLKEQIRARDHYRCQQCFRHQDELRDKNNKKMRLSIHHIDFNKKNNNPNNLISLCNKCHLQTNYNREDWITYFQDKIQNLMEVSK